MESSPVRSHIMGGVFLKLIPNSNSRFEDQRRKKESMIDLSYAPMLESFQIVCHHGTGSPV